MVVWETSVLGGDMHGDQVSRLLLKFKTICKLRVLKRADVTSISYNLI